MKLLLAGLLFTLTSSVGAQVHKLPESFKIIPTFNLSDVAYYNPSSSRLEDIIDARREGIKDSRERIYIEANSVCAPKKGKQVTPFNTFEFMENHAISSVGFICSE